MSKKTPINYVDNKTLFNDLLEYRAQLAEARKKGLTLPCIPDKIGQSFILMATNRSTEHNFRGYPFLEEMIADAYEDCVRRIEKFDPNITENPFAYFSQVIFFAFVRRIKQEKKYLYIKYKSIEHATLFNETCDIQGHTLTEAYRVEIQSSENYDENRQQFIKDYETGLQKK